MSALERAESSGREGEGETRQQNMDGPAHLASHHDHLQWLRVRDRRSPHRCDGGHRQAAERAAAHAA